MICLECSVESRIEDDVIVAVSLYFCPAERFFEFADTHQGMIVITSRCSSKEIAVVESSFSASSKHLELQKMMDADIAILWIAIGESIEIGDRCVIIDGNTATQHIIIFVCNKNIAAVVCFEICHESVESGSRYIVKILQINYF